MTKKNKIIAAIAIFLISGFAIGKMAMQPDTQNKLNVSKGLEVNKNKDNFREQETSVALDTLADLKSTQIIQSPNTKGFIGYFDDKPLDNPIDNIFHINIEEELQGNETVWLEYELYGVEDYTGIAHSVNDQLSVGGYMVKQSKEWKKQREQLHPSVLKQGDNVVRFTLPEDSDYGYIVRNLSVTIEPFNEINSVAQSERRLIVNQPTTEYYYGNLGYLQGYVIGADDSKAEILIDGEPIRYNKGTFESLVKKNSSKENWTVKVQAVFHDGQVLTAEVPFNKPAKWDKQNGFIKDIHYAEQTIKVADALDVSLDKVRLKADSGAVSKTTNVSITALRERDIPALDAGMVNVTYGANGEAGYRFLPHGTQFKKDVVVEMAYDTTKIPNGYGTNDIRTYFFNEQKHRWVAIPRDTVLLASHTTVSRTNHFSDYINAIIKVPESPETQGYTPTSMKDVKAANPATGINMIQPPSANSMGNANLSYPINIPAGRQGMQPQLGISYSSGGGNGWLGLGWDLSVPSITVDTRWGVPRYNKDKESETYTMGGEQLTPVAHRSSVLEDRTSDKQFYPRVEGSFSIIKRHGDKPSNYWWEVTDKSGVKYYYGASSVSKSVVSDAVLTDANGNIAHWALVEIRDLNDNFVKYNYTVVEDAGVDGAKLKGYQIYLQSALYTGHGSENGAYTVNLYRDRDLPNFTKRQDVTINARYGFKQVTADLLKVIEVKFGSETVRSYELNYIPGAFNKTLLETITEKDSKGAVFNTHTLEYYDNVGDGASYFLNDEEWSAGKDNVHKSLAVDAIGFSDKASLLGGTQSSNWSAGMAVTAGFNDFQLWKKSLTAGGNFSYGESTSEGLLALVDINGDGLSDKVFQDGDEGLWFRPQLKEPNDNGDKYGNRKPIKGINQFLKEESSTTGGGFEANFVLFVGTNKSKTKSKTSIYFTDVNGDGLIDIIKNGIAWFNYIDEEGIPNFTKDVNQTPSKILGSADVNPELISQFEPEDEEVFIDENPLHDMVRMWKAPFDGKVSINAPVNLIQDNSSERGDYKKADGVRLTIQHKGNEIWFQSIGESDYSTYTPNIKNLAVKKGDQIYFRVQSMFDGLYDKVNWNPEIAYIGESEDVVDANNKTRYKYVASDDFIVSGHQTIGAPYKGVISIDGVFHKEVTSDDILLEIIKTDKDGNSVTEFSKSFKWNDSGNFNITEPIEVERLDNLSFKLSTSTNIDWHKIEWLPHVYYSESKDDDFKNVYDKKGNPTISTYATSEYTFFSDELRAQENWQSSIIDTVVVKPQLEFTKDVKGEITFAIKKLNSLVDKQKLSIVDTLGVVDTTIVTLKKEEQLYFEFTSSDRDLMTKIKNATVVISSSTVQDTITAAVFTTIDPEIAIFGNMYRGWGQFAYRGNRDWASSPINESELKLDEKIEKLGELDIKDDASSDDISQKVDEVGYDPAKSNFIMLYPSAADKAWIGYDEETYIKATIQSSSRMGRKNLDDIPTFETENGLFFGINKLTESTSSSTFGGASFGGIGGNYSNSEGTTTILTDFMDLNGDRYPDLIIKNSVQYTVPTGGLEEGVKPLGVSIYQKIKTNSEGVSLSASPVLSKASGATSNPKKVTFDVGNGQASAGLSGNYGSGSNSTPYGWVDINGDGLVDRVWSNGDVSLNLGYSFAEIENWTFNSIAEGESKSGGAGLGISIGNGSISAGVGLSLSANEQKSSLMDVNGDGLVDLVRVSDSQVKVRLNTGCNFATEINWGSIGSFGKSSSTSESANFAFTIGFSPVLIPVKFCVNPSGSFGHGVSRELVRLSDLDGDGFPDYVSSESDDKLKIRKSNIGQTNLLKTVNRPLKGKFTIDYKPVGNTYEMPQSVWTLSKVTMDDGHAGDGVDMMQTAFEYGNGYHDRHERAFYGFGEVMTNQLDESGDTYRSTTRTFANGNYFEKGLLLNETIEDSNGKKYVETINEYELKDRNMVNLTNGAEKASSTIAFPALVKTTKQFYEGKSEAQKSTYTTFEYGSYGNVRKYVDYGDTGADDDISAIIDYHEVTDKNILSVPKSITVTGSGKTLRQRSTLIDNATGKITKITQKADKTDAIYDLYYDNYGNLDSIVRPANYKGERMYFAYDYDNTVHSYVTAVRDAYGYSSSTTYDYKFGQVLSTTDINGKQTVYQIDDLGRITNITGPYELESGQDYTIHFDYFPNAEIPWAQTQHYDPEHPENPIETAIFIDGLGRVLQTKKDGAIFKGKDAEDKEVMLVSGKVMYDAFGRSITSYYPVSEDKGNIGTFNTQVDKVKPTTVEYDALDRALITTLPDGAKTETLYGFGEDRDGNSQFMTRVTDANGIITESFTDVKGRQTAVKAPGDIWTSFVYNAINELVSVTDAEDNTTVSTYDILGRRLSRLHPDAGLTEYTYDASGNMLTQMTANLRENNKPITYEYEYNRLTNITYPENTVNNVRFEYGKAGSKHNRAGRIAVQEDATGAQEFFYGNLGEITKNIRTIIVPDEGVYTFETQWEYDTWNRLKKMTYPDGEELTYEYNTGGLLRSMYGSKKGHVYDYLTQIGYDEFEDRAYIAYGNGTETTYEYEEDRRRLHNIVVSTSSGRAMMDNTYTYDAVNNITQLKSVAPIPTENKKGGNFEYNYVYDDLYRLTNASGTYQNISHQHQYTMDMQYSETGRILHKSQVHQRKEYDETTWGPRHKTTYDLEYKYEGEQPHAPTQIGENVYTYDANGNTTGWQSTKNNNRRDILWDEENRIRALADNGKTHHYMYDASGERVIKSTGDGQAIYINGFPMGGSGTVGNYTMYVNPYMVVTNMKFTKHFYIEGQRIVSKLGEMGEYQYLLNPKDTVAGGGTIDFDLKGKELKDAIYANFENLGLDGAVFTAGKSGKVPYGKLKKYYRNQDLVNAGGNTNQPDYDEEPSNKVENLQFYYHPDHLGSSSYITDVSGEVYQHMEYLPFGETFIEERTDAEYTSYLYNGKELDEETGLYYYGARYYDPRISMWYGVDPLTEKYPGISSFAYVANNPIKLIDPNGMEIIEGGESKARESQAAARKKIASYSLKANKLRSNDNLTNSEQDQLKEYENMIEILDNHINNLEDMINTKDMKFRYVEVNSDFERETGPNRKDGVIEIQYNSDYSQAHEENHAAQFLKGELKITQNKRGRFKMVNDSYDIHDEAESMRVGYSYMGTERQQQERDIFQFNYVYDINSSNLSKSKGFRARYGDLVSKEKRNQKK